MKDAAKRDWRNSPLIWMGVVIFAALWLVSLFLPMNSLLPVLMSVIAMTVVIWLLISQRSRIKSDQRPYIVPLILAITGLISQKLNDGFFHFRISDGLMLALTLLILGWLIVAVLQAGQIRQSQAEQQKQLDQTRLEPIYGESAKHDKVKEQ